MTDHITNSDPHCGPYASLTDDKLLSAYKRVTADPDNAEAAVVTADYGTVGSWRNDYLRAGAGLLADTERLAEVLSA